MKTNTLVFWVLGTFAFFAAAYVVLSPLASNTNDDDYEAIVSPSESTTTSTAEQVATKTPETTPVVAPKPVTTTPKPATSQPAPTPAPTPAPAPAPAPTSFTMAQVQAHGSEQSCWTTINGNVYDVTAYIPKHPGGKSKIIKICGKDGSSLFEGQHGGDSGPENTLQKYWIGTLQ